MLIVSFLKMLIVSFLKILLVSFLLHWYFLGLRKLTIN